MPMKSMRTPKTDTDPPSDGVDVHLSHDHMQKLGMKTPPSVGTKIAFNGEGEVTASHSSNTADEPNHHMRITLHKAGLTQDDRGGLRKAVQEAADAADQKRGKK